MFIARRGLSGPARSCVFDEVSGSTPTKQVRQFFGQIRLCYSLNADLKITGMIQSEWVLMSVVEIALQMKV